MAKIGLILALAGCVLGPLLVRAGLPYRLGLGLFTLGTLVAAGLGLWLARENLWALLGVLPLVLVAPMVLKALSLPPVADVMTRLQPAIEFIAPPPGENGLAISAAVSEAHHSHYQDLRTRVDVDTPRAWVLAHAKRAGWVLTQEREQALQFEVRSRIFGFTDDVMVRWTTDGGSVRVDARSRSRVGVSDLGANAKRLRALLSVAAD